MAGQYFGQSQADKDKLMQQLLREQMDQMAMGPDTNVIGGAGTDVQPMQGEITAAQQAAIYKAQQAPYAGQKELMNVKTLSGGTALAKTLAAGVNRWAGEKERGKEIKVLRGAAQAQADKKLADQLKKDKLAEDKVNREIAGTEYDVLQDDLDKDLAADALKLSIAKTKYDKEAALEKARALKEEQDRKAKLAQDKFDYEKSQQSAGTKDEQAKGQENLSNMLERLTATHLEFGDSALAPTEFSWDDPLDAAGSVIGNLGKKALTASGALVAAGSPEGALQTKVEGFTNQIIPMIAAASGMSSKNWDSNRELQALKDGLGKVGNSPESNISLIESIYDNYATGPRPPWLIDARKELTPQEGGGGLSAEEKKRMEELKLRFPNG